MELFAIFTAVVLTCTAGFLIHLLLFQWTRHHQPLSSTISSTHLTQQASSSTQQQQSSVPSVAVVAVVAASSTTNTTITTPITSPSAPAAANSSTDTSPKILIQPNFQQESQKVQTYAMVSSPSPGCDLVASSLSPPETCVWLQKLFPLLFHSITTNREIPSLICIALNSALSEFRIHGIETYQLQILECHTGKVAPTISNLQFVNRSDGLEWEYLAMDCDVNYNATTGDKISFQITAELPLSSATPVSSSLIVGVTQFSAKTRIVWNSNTDENHHLFLSFVSPPVLELEVSSVTTNKNLAHVGAVLSKTIGGILSQSMIWPSQKLIQIEGFSSESVLSYALHQKVMSANASNLAKSKLKFLSATNFDSIQIKLVEAEGLAAKDSNGFSDPYVIVSIGPGPDQTYRSKTVKKSLSPKWNEEFVLRLSGDSKEISFELFDKDRIGKDDFLGCATVLLASLPVTPIPYQRRLQLQTKPNYENEVITGLITIEFVFSQAEVIEKEIASKTKSLLVDSSSVPTLKLNSQPLPALTSSPLKSTESQNLPTIASSSSSVTSSYSSLSSSSFSLASTPSPLTGSSFASPTKQETLNRNQLSTPTSSDGPVSNLTRTPSDSSTSSSFSRNTSDRSSTRSNRLSFFGSRRESVSSGSNITDSYSLNNLSLDLKEIQFSITHQNLEGSSVFHKKSQLLYEVLESNEKASTNEISATPKLTQYVVDKSMKPPQKSTKLHVFNGHTFVATHFSNKEKCHHCSENLNGMVGKQGYQCRDCLKICHKECHVLVTDWCQFSKVNEMNLAVYGQS